MSGPRRLPVAGPHPRRGPAPEVPAHRPPCAVPTVVVLPAAAHIDPTPFVQAFAQAAAERGLRVEVVRGAAEPGADVDVRVGIGPEVALRCAPRLTVLVTGGVLPVAWDGPARALRGHVDLLLAEPRPKVAAGIARAW